MLFKLKLLLRFHTRPYGSAFKLSYIVLGQTVPSPMLTRKRLKERACKRCGERFATTKDSPTCWKWSCYRDYHMVNG